MKARVPVDVDLEDRLLYGLTPPRLGYVAIAAMAALAAYRMAGPLAVRLPLCILLLAVAAAAGWARYDGRHADRWVIDAATYIAANFRPVFAPQVTAVRLPRQQREAPAPEPPPQPELAVPADQMHWLRGA